jgi:uncharacterized YigZ family protein
MVEAASRYPIPARPHRVEEVIRRSRFITAASHAPDPETARSFIAGIKDEYPDATHHCWAFVAGPPGSTAAIGMSDDGEPHGTAGRPMLTALLHGGVGEIVAVCVRYYGGTNLGTGGLSRAYSGGVKLLLDSLVTKERIERAAFKVVVDYSLVAAIQRLWGDLEAEVESEDYLERVEYRVRIPREHAEAFSETVAGVTKGKGTVTRL